LSEAEAQVGVAGVKRDGGGRTFEGFIEQCFVLFGLEVCVEGIHFGEGIKIFVILGISLCGDKERLFGVIEYLPFLHIGAIEVLDVEPAIHSRGIGAEGVIICGGVEEIVGELGLTESYGKAGGGDFGGAFRDGNESVVEIRETYCQGNNNSGGFEPQGREGRRFLLILSLCI